ncbi:G-protein coupled receptor 157-like [Mytilus edulis]|uniref:G-protein coupled receptor 157-like n=1 Tax=Mytilus edulis TaxID=6550 RepID=UPI0039EE795A
MNQTTFDVFDLTISARITTVSSSMSLVGGIIIILSYRYIPATQNQVRAMLVALTVADMLTALGYEISSLRWYTIGMKNSDTSDIFCKAQSFLTTFSSMSSFFWTTFIALYLFHCVWFSTDLQVSRSQRLWLHCIAWGLPGVITSVALLYGVLGNNGFALNGVWCWLDKTFADKYGLHWMLLTGKGWEILTYLITASLYTSLKIRTFLKRGRHNSYLWNQVSNGLRREDELFCFTWLILYCLRVWGTIRFVIDIIEDGNHIKNAHVEKFKVALLFLQSYGDSAQAFWNFILFCVCDNTVRSFSLDNLIPLNNHKKVSTDSADIHSNPQENTNTNLQKDNEQQPLLHSRKLTHSVAHSHKNLTTSV